MSSIGGTKYGGDHASSLREDIGGGSPPSWEESGSGGEGRGERRIP